MYRALIDKAWCETRSRWAIGLATLAVVIGAGRGEPALGESTKTVFVLLAIVLGTGALRQERALGTLGFSLALPVPRRVQIVVRAAVAIAGVCVLAGFVTVWAPLVSWLDGGEVESTWRLGVIWAVCGSLIACLAQLLAALLASDYLVYLGTLLIVMAYEMVIQLTALREQPLCDLYRVMSGGPSLPWPSLGGAIAISAAMLAVASRAARRLAP